MDIISAEEWQLLSFFEVEPTSLDKDEVWPDNHYLYEIVCGEFELFCSIAPGYKDVRIIHTRKGSQV